jgi:hypothetical protein
MHALSPFLRKCAKFQIDWTGRGVLNIDCKICGRQTSSEVEEKCCNKQSNVTIAVRCDQYKIILPVTLLDECAGR